MASKTEHPERVLGMATVKTVFAEFREDRREPHRLLPPREPSNFSKLVSQLWFKKTLFLSSDVAAIAFAHYLTESLMRSWLKVPLVYLNPPHYYVFYVPFFAAVLFFFDGYKDPGSRRPEKELELGFQAITSFFVALACANFILFKPQGFSRYLLTSWYGLSILFVLGARFGLRGFYNTLWRHGVARETAVLAGSASRVIEMRRQFSVQRHLRYDVLGALLELGTDTSLESSLADLSVLGTLEDWEKIVDQFSVRWLILSLSANDFGQYSNAQEIARRCHEKGVSVQVYSDLFGSSEFQYERDEFSGCFHFSSRPRWSRPLQMACKTLMDRIVGIVGSIATLALTPIVALLLKIEDPGPVFYRREFVDQDGVIRYYLKFRSMVNNADQELQTNHALRQQFDHKYKLEQDPRVLKVGRILRKYSIDEFPQFLSLLTGRLSFVGPRVISGAEASRYGNQLSRLLSVKPGLTGFWQVTGRQTTSYEERIQMDMFYIEHWSIWLDLVIAAKTFWKVLRADGAY